MLLLSPLAVRRLSFLVFLANPTSPNSKIPSPSLDLHQAIKNAVSFLKNPSLSAEAVAMGRNQLKLQILSEADAGTSLAESIATQGMYTGKVVAPTELVKMIDQVSNQHVTDAYAKAVRTKLSLGAVGNLVFVPFVDEI